MLSWLALPVGQPGTIRRVARGGSWNNNQDNARAAYRNNNHPDNRNNNIGFRLVCVAHIVQAFAPDPALPGWADVTTALRKCPPTTVGGPSRRRCGWRRPVPSARITQEGETPSGLYTIGVSPRRKPRGAPP